MCELRMIRMVSVAVATLTMICGAAVLADQHDGARRTALTSRVLLKLAHPTETRQKLIEQAKSLGGFPVIVTAVRLQLKVPPERFGELLKIVGQSGLVLEKTLTRQDLGAQIADFEAKVRARTQILRRLRSFLEGSSLAVTLNIEQRMLNLVTELEQTKGQLALWRERARWGVIDVDFRFRERERTRYVESRFEWLNSVQLERFLEEF